MSAIARQLNDEGVPTPDSLEGRHRRSGLLWLYGSVRVILLNPAYAGDLVWNRRTLGKFYRITATGAAFRPSHECGVRRWNSPDDWFVKKGAHAALVSHEVFEHAQQIRKAREGVSRRSSLDCCRDESDYRARYILTGITYCARCGLPFWGFGLTRYYPQRRRRAYMARMYGCRDYHQGVHGQCKKGMIRQRILERIVIARITQWYAGYLAQGGARMIRAAAADQCREFAKSTCPRLAFEVSKIEVRTMAKNAIEFLRRLPSELKETRTQSRRMALRRCITKIKVDLAGRRVVIWVRRLPIFGATAGGTVRLSARLPERRQDFTMGRKKRLRWRQQRYSWRWHMAGKPQHVRTIARAAHRKIMGLGPAIRCTMHQKYAAYSIYRHIACMKFKQARVLLYLRLNPGEIVDPSIPFRDVTNIGTQATGRVEVSVASIDDLERAMPLLEKAYEDGCLEASRLGPPSSFALEGVGDWDASTRGRVRQSKR